MGYYLFWLTNIIGMSIHRRIQMVLKADAVVAQHFVIQFVFFDGRVGIDGPRDVVFIPPLGLGIRADLRGPGQSRQRYDFFILS